MPIKGARYRFKKGYVIHRGKKSRERLTFVGRKKVVEVKFYPVRKHSKLVAGAKSFINKNSIARS